MATATADKPATSRKPKGFEPRIVHAYRREPHMVLNLATGQSVERDVEVVCCGERVKFRANDMGHVVATVTTQEAYKRLVEEIPEAYIEYQGGENIPEKRVEPAPEVPLGDFVLTNGKQSVVLDHLEDEQLRDFARVNGFADQLHDSLTGDTLRRAIYNIATTG